MGADITTEWNSAFPMAWCPSGALQSGAYCNKRAVISKHDSFWTHSEQNHGTRTRVTGQKRSTNRRRSKLGTTLKPTDVFNSYSDFWLSEASK